MIKKITAYILSICVMCTCVINFTVTAHAEPWGEYNSEDGMFHISNAQQLVELSEATKTTGHPALGGKFVLDNDITIPATLDNQINIASDSNNPFFGTFDGNGHTITGLKHSTYATDSGLFGFTDGALIKNLNIDYADIQTINRGGIVVGHAEDTDFLNISVTNSHIKIISGGVAIELITADGATIGGIAGEAIEDCHMYNCETVDTLMDTGEAEGVAALGGDGYYIGGLVGTLDNSHIEYSRTLSTTSTDSGKINANLVVAVSALSFKSIYVGGIVGEMKNGASVIDSFSNIELYSDPATGVTVIGAVYGYLGGIVGAVYGNNCKLERCHYSGKAYQKDFGGLLIVVPVDNTHRGGIIGHLDECSLTDRDMDGKGTFNNLYFNYDRVMEATGSGESNDDECSVAYVNTSAGIYYTVDTSGHSCGSFTNDDYADQTNSWENNGFDFKGSVLRDTPCNIFFSDNGNGGQHVNQWVMETYNYTNTGDTAYAATTMPVHGVTTMKIYSNVNNAFTDTDPVNMSYQYTVNADDTITMPDETALSAINPNMENSGFIGIALVSERDGESGTKVYTCDYMFEAGTNVDSDIIETYIFDSNDKAIYGVWCQAYTLGAQIGLNNDNSNKGLRVLTAVNTDMLDNIGLSETDVDYGRGATFNVDGNDYIIEADSKEWRGENYITGGSYNGSSISDYVSNARVFSIFLALDDNELDKEITYGGDILYNAVNSEGVEVILDYLCNQMKNSAGNIAEAYIADLEKSGESADNYYGIGEDVYNNLMEYIA